MKKAVAEAAVNEVSSNMIVGLGSGSTAAIMIKTLANKLRNGELKKISGVHREMPVTFLAVCVSGASMAGIPPLLGFYVKELVYEASLAAPVAAIILTAIVVLANMMMAAVAFILVIKPFWGEKKPTKVNEANFNMSVNALLVAIFTLLLSVFTETLNQYILSPSGTSHSWKKRIG